MTSNPLLSLDELPRFAEITPPLIEPAVSAMLARNREQLALVLAASQNRTAPDWKSLMLPLDEMEDRLNKLWSTVSHLNAVKNTAELRDAYNRCQPMITAYYTELGQNRELSDAVRKLAERADAISLDSAQRKILRDYQLDFKLAGVDLEDEKKREFAALETRLSELSNRFSNNVLDSTMAWFRHVTDVNLLAGVPSTTVQAAAGLAQRKGLEGHVLTLDAPCYLAVITNADNPALRREIYEAYVTRASDNGPHAPVLDNRDIIDEILACRAQLASLLGYHSYAEVSVARKMASSVERVNHFLKDLADLAMPAARREFQELQEFAAAEHGVGNLDAWDIPFYSEKLRKKNFDVSQEELRPYFPLNHVRQGLFDIAKLIYGVTIVANKEMPLWEAEVAAFDVLRDGALIARFYMDLYTRDGKKSGAWMGECRSRRRLEDGSLQIPVAYLVCNFARGSDSVPALLTHNEVTTLFHEFGHGLHHMLTAETYLRSSGINGVAWDAVELPSQLMENWCWDPRAIAMISSHFETGASLPSNLLEKLLAAKNFQAGMRMARQLEFALFDFQLHQIGISTEKIDVFSVIKSVRALTSAYPVPAINRFQNSFSHIFAGGYAAGYYSYKWAEVLSADVFSRFTETGVFSPDTGARFLTKVLSRGGGADPLELFTDFMGREPSTESLLRQDGLIR